MLGARQSRSLIAAVGLAVMSLLISACSAVFAAEPNEAGEIQVVLLDNRITPSVIRVKAGQKVRFVITNQGAHPHEFMIGREPVEVDNYLDLQSEVVEAFHVDFFEGVEVTVSGTGMPMNFEGMEPMDMDGMEMGDEAPHDEGGMDMGGEEAPHGAMVMLQPGTPGTNEPGQTSIIEFVVPEDKVGVWQIGCFQEAGQHFADGMQATLIVEP